MLNDDQTIVSCPKCMQKLRIPTDKGRIRIRCKTCGEIFYKEYTKKVIRGILGDDFVVCPHCFHRIRVDTIRGHINKCTVCHRKFKDNQALQDQMYYYEDMDLIDFQIMINDRVKLPEYAIDVYIEKIKEHRRMLGIEDQHDEKEIRASIRKRK